MRFILERTVAPTVEPVTLAEMIQHVREFSSIPQAAQDEISGLITAAREWAEQYTARALVEQTWRLTLDLRAGNGPGRALLPPVGWPELNGYGWIGMEGANVDGWLLRRSPVIAIVSVASVDQAGVETAIDAADYLLNEPLSRWPRLAATNGGTLPGDRFSIVFRAGFAAGVGSPDPEPDTALVPETFKQAIKLYAGALYDRDKDMMQRLQDAAAAILQYERADLSLA